MPPITPPITTRRGWPTSRPPLGALAGALPGHTALDSQEGQNTPFTRTLIEFLTPDAADAYDSGLDIRRAMLGDDYVARSLASATDLTRAFQDMITPFKSLLTIASSEEATIAASLDADSSGRNDIRVLCPRESGESDGRPRLGTISTSGAVDSFLSLNAPIPALSVFLSYDDRAQSGFV